MRLRNPLNQPTELGTLFIYSKLEEDQLDQANNADTNTEASGKRRSILSKVKEFSDGTKIEGVKEVCSIIFCLVIVKTIVRT